MALTRNDQLAYGIREGFMAGKTKIEFDIEVLEGAKMMVLGYRTDSDKGVEADQFDLRVAMLVSAAAFPDRTTMTMMPSGTDKFGNVVRWMEFVIRGEEDPQDGYRSSLKTSWFMEPPAAEQFNDQAGYGWIKIPSTEVDISVVGDLAFFNIAEQDPDHDGTPQALVVFGTLRTDDYYPSCRMVMDISVIPENRRQPVKQLDVDAIIKRASLSEDNPGWGQY